MTFVIPGGPWSPGVPGRPCGPVAPVEPVNPVLPWRPWIPCGPVAPVSPFGPCGPGGPWRPWEPAGPCVPVLLSLSLWSFLSSSNLTCLQNSTEPTKSLQMGPFYIHTFCHLLNIGYNYFRHNILAPLLDYCCWEMALLITLPMNSSKSKSKYWLVHILISKKKYIWTANNSRVRNSIKQIREWQLNFSLTNHIIQNNAEKCFISCFVNLISYLI